MRFWQVFEAQQRIPAQSIFGLSLPNWKTEPREAEDGLKLHLDGTYPDYAHVYINFVGTCIAEINGKSQISGSPQQVEDKLRDMGIIKYAGYDDTH
jgi:hypothetical protein